MRRPPHARSRREDSAAHADPILSAPHAQEAAEDTPLLRARGRCGPAGRRRQGGLAPAVQRAKQPAPGVGDLAVQVGAADPEELRDETTALVDDATPVSARLT